jgi:hypothetical protein
MTGKQTIGNLRKESFVACYDVIYRHSSPYTKNKHEKSQNGKSCDQDSNGALYEHDLEMLLLETVGLLIYRAMKTRLNLGVKKMVVRTTFSSLSMFLVR